jgi:Zn-dependent M32 family carboxypeptidase
MSGALMDIYEPGAQSAEIGALFSRLGPEIAALISRDENLESV